MPRPLSPEHGAIMDTLVEGIGEADGVETYDRSPGAVRPIHVENVAPLDPLFVGWGPIVGVTRLGFDRDGRWFYEPDVELVRTSYGWVPLVHHQGNDCRISAALVYSGIEEINSRHAAEIPDLVEAFLDEIKATQWPLVLRKQS